MIKKVWTSVKKAFLSFWKWRWRNYVLIAVFFAVWALIFSPNTIWTQIKIRRENRELKRLKHFYEEEIERNEAQIEKFKTDGDYVETFGRETYLMKADKEDIFLFVEEEKTDTKQTKPNKIK